MFYLILFKAYVGGHLANTKVLLYKSFAWKNKNKIKRIYGTNDNGCRCLCERLALENKQVKLK
jgi:hypothetical protein